MVSTVKNCEVLIVSKMDATQEALLNEKCFLVDKNDKVVGQATKKECHLIHPNDKILLHRAFSVFLFNKKGELLIQRRAPTKITYPNRYTNTCCSHPLSDISGEEDENEAIGIKRAAIRRLNYELGIPPDRIPLEKLQYITRIHYKDQGDGKYGEHEIDYIIFIQDDVEVNLNLNEVAEVRYVSRKTLTSFLKEAHGQLTPWFELILKHNLMVWWDNLDNLDKFMNCENILRLEF